MSALAINSMSATLHVEHAGITPPPRSFTPLTAIGVYNASTRQRTVTMHDHTIELMIAVATPAQVDQSSVEKYSSERVSQQGGPPSAHGGRTRTQH